MKKMILGLATGVAAIAMAASAQAAGNFTATYGSSIGIPSNNNFDTCAGCLNSLGLYDLSSDVSSITVPWAVKVTFEYLGAESRYNDTFNWGGLTPGSATEDGGVTGGIPGPTNNFGAPVVLGSTIVGAGALPVWFTTDGTGATAADAYIGDAGFGLFLPSGASNPYVNSVLYFGYDDNIGDASDDNHDDFIIRATLSSVPEPATWATMMLGFGLVGAAMRRSRKQVASAIC